MLIGGIQVISILHRLKKIMREDATLENAYQGYLKVKLSNMLYLVYFQQ